MPCFNLYYELLSPTHRPLPKYAFWFYCNQNHSPAFNMAPAEPNAIPFRPKGEIPKFEEEYEGWKGYIEWEKYPEKKKQAEEILRNYDFPDVRASHLRVLLTMLIMCNSLPNFNWCRCQIRTQSSPESASSSITTQQDWATSPRSAGNTCSRRRHQT